MRAAVSCNLFFAPLSPSSLQISVPANLHILRQQVENNILPIKLNPRGALFCVRDVSASTLSPRLEIPFVRYCCSRIIYRCTCVRACVRASVCLQAPF